MTIGVILFILTLADVQSFQMKICSYCWIRVTFGFEVRNECFPWPNVANEIVKCLISLPAFGHRHPVVVLIVSICRS